MRKIDKEYYEEKQGSLYLQYYSDLLDGTLKIYERQKKEKTKLPFFVFTKSGILQIQKKNKKERKNNYETERHETK